MAVKTLHNAASSGAVPGPATSYNPCTQGSIRNSTVEAQVQSRCWRPRTYSNMYVNVSANTHSTSTVITFRINGANGNQTITIPASTTGYFEDAVNTDAVVVNDDVNFQIVRGTGGSSTFANIGVYAENLGALVVQISGVSSATFSTAGTFNQAFGQIISTDTNTALWLARTNFRARNAEVFVSSNTRNNTSTIAGCSIPASTTGRFFNTTTFSDVVAPSNTGYSVIIGGSSGSLVVNKVTHELAFPNGIVQYANTAQTSSLGTSLSGTRIMSISGVPVNANPNNSAVKMLENCTFSNFTYNTGAHGQLTTSGITYEYYKNGVATGMTVSEAVNTFGNVTLEDTVNTFTMNTTDTVDARFTRAGGNNSSVCRFWGVLVDYTNFVPMPKSGLGGFF